MGFDIVSLLSVCVYATLAIAYTVLFTIVMGPLVPDVRAVLDACHVRAPLTTMVNTCSMFASDAYIYLVDSVLYVVHPPTSSFASESDDLATRLADYTWSFVGIHPDSLLATIFISAILLALSMCFVSFLSILLWYFCSFKAPLDDNELCLIISLNTKVTCAFRKLSQLSKRLWQQSSLILAITCAIGTVWPTQVLRYACYRIPFSRRVAYFQGNLEGIRRCDKDSFYELYRRLGRLALFSISRFALLMTAILVVVALYVYSSLIFHAILDACIGRWSVAPAQVQRNVPAHHPSIPATNVISIPDNLCVEAETFSYYFLEGYYIHPDFVAKYELGYELGVGGNGLVLQARRRSDGQEVAVKFVYKGDDTEHWFQHPKYGPVTRDVVIMERAKHENIVALLDVFGDEDYLYIVQELRGNIWYPVTKTGKKKFPNGSRCLQGLLSQERVLPLERTKYIFYQLVDAVAHLHSLGISHCDIKPRNILVDSDFKVTLIDFGNCITRPECIPLGHGRVIYGDPDYYRGTRRFYPPEILNELEFDAEAADVWALGLVLCHMLLGRIPFQDTNDVRDGIFMRHFNGWEPLLPMWTVVSSCLETRRTFRATAAELQLRDSFLHTARRRQIYEEPLCIGEWREQK